MTGQTNFWPYPSKEFSTTFFICANLYQLAKNQLIWFIHSGDTVNSRVLRPNWTHPFLVMPNHKIFNRLLTSVNLCEHAKQGGYFINLLWRNSWFKNSRLVESILAYISGKDFPQKSYFCRNTANNINFHYSTNSVKTNNEIFL